MPIARSERKFTVLSGPNLEAVIDQTNEFLMRRWELGGSMFVVKIDGVVNYFQPVRYPHDDDPW